LEISEKKLISLCKGHDRRAFDLLLQRYEKFIYGLCYRYTSSREDSLDLLQEIYLKLFKSIDRFNESQPLTPWIRRIAVNTCFNFIRGRKQPSLSLDSTVDEGGTAVEDLVASSINVEDVVSSRATKKILEDLIRELPQEYRMAIILRHVDGLSYNEIAKAMSLPEGTIKTYLFRGRRLLKDKLQRTGILEV
jgi:RNA polymerase sigma-70 factor (ECF subfamily)